LEQQTLVGCRNLIKTLIGFRRDRRVAVFLLVLGHVRIEKKKEAANCGGHSFGLLVSRHSFKDAINVRTAL
jgi:hypothetical protein